MADALIGTGFPFRKGDNFKRYLKMFEEVMQHCAGVRRPGAAALDLCYVAAGWYDGFFETGLQPWDVAAGSLLVTEAGGLVGQLHRRGRLPPPARGDRGQPEDLRAARADAGALHAGDRCAGSAPRRRGEGAGRQRQPLARGSPGCRAPRRGDGTADRVAQEPRPARGGASRPADVGPHHDAAASPASRPPAQPWRAGGCSAPASGCRARLRWEPSAWGPPAPRRCPPALRRAG
jgi:hypothetical protein